MRVETYNPVSRDFLLAIASYGITFVRLLIAVFAAISILREENNWFAIASIVLVMVLDCFDGFTFDRSQLSALKKWRINRRIADSVSDRVVIQIVCISVLVQNPAFLWPYLLILGRELAISSYVSKYFAKGILVYPRAISKMACAMVGGSVIAFLILPVFLSAITTGVMVTWSVFALIDYVRRVQTHNASTPRRLEASRDLEEIF